jgi:hypothetical protein
MLSASEPFVGRLHDFDHDNGLHERQSGIDETLKAMRSTPWRLSISGP